MHAIIYSLLFWVFAIHVCYGLFICVWPLQIKVSRGESWDPINRFNPVKLVCLFQDRTLISNAICRDLSWVQWFQLRWEVIFRFVDIGEIDDHHYSFQRSFYNGIIPVSYLMLYYLSLGYWYIFYYHAIDRKTALLM